MTNDKEFDQINNLLREAYVAGLCKKSAEIARHGVTLSTSVGNTYWRVRFLFWQGRSLADIGDRKAAQIALLQAANPDPEADPADQYNAVCALIDISLRERTAGFCRSLISQARSYLSHVRKETWSHKLDYLEGDLEFYRGAFDLAYSCKQRAWDCARQSNEYPRYTMASYVSDLVKTSFVLRDPVSLARWQLVLRDCESVTDGDNAYKQLGDLLLLRARRIEDGLSTMAPTALSLLRHAQASEFVFGNENRAALRSLAIAAHWAAVDDWLPRLIWDPSDFADQLFRGDERVCRARYTLGITVQDDEWEEGLEEISSLCSLVLEPASRAQAAALLAQAKSHYDSVRSTAEVEDHRLETTWYTGTLKQRLARVSALVGVLK